MKTVTLTVGDEVYAFYEKVGAHAGRAPEQVMADGLLRLAAQLAEQMRRPLPFPETRGER